MKKTSILQIVVVLMLISLVSGFILTLANNKFSPIIKARESDKMRIVAAQLLPEGAQISKVTNYTELASLVKDARRVANLSPEWRWDPEASPIEATQIEEEKEPEVEIEMDLSEWDFFFEDEDDDDNDDYSEDVSATASATTEADADDAVVEEESFDFDSLFATEVVVGEDKEEDDDFDFDSLFATEVVLDEEDDDASDDDFDFDSLFGAEVTVAPEETAETDTDPAETEEEAPAFELYQAVSGGKLVGVALVSKARGYGGDISLMLALDGTLEKVLGMDILQQSETAGLGDAITGDKFTSQFTDKPVGTPFEVGRDIQGVAGATISSKGVATALQNGLKNLQQFLIDGTIEEGA